MYKGVKCKILQHMPNQKFLWTVLEVKGFCFPHENL